MESSLATGMRLLLDIVTLALYVQTLILFYEASDLTFYVLHWEHTKKQDRAMCPKQKELCVQSKSSWSMLGGSEISIGIILKPKIPTWAKQF